MSRATNQPEETQLVKLLLIGESKSGKDHYAMEAAEAGFNLILLDGDVGRQTVNRKKSDGSYFFSEAARYRTFLIDAADRVDSTRFGRIVSDLFSARPIAYWDDTNSKIVNPNLDDLTESEVWEIAVTKLTHNDILVIDTWTSLSYSEMRRIAAVQGEKLEDMDKAPRDVYQPVGNKLTAFLTMIQHIQCHVIVLAHPDEFLQYKKPLNKSQRDAKEGDLVLKKQIMIPKSSSKPHGYTMGKYFSDILWIEQSHTEERWIDGRTDPNKIVGSRFTGRKKSKEYSFAELVRQAGGVIPKGDGTTPGIVEHSKGSFTKPEPKASKVLDGTKSQQVKGLLGVVKKS